MRKCKICDLNGIEEDFDVCKFCGWESDPLQENNPDYIGGANEMSLNQYKQFWGNNKIELLKIGNTSYSIKKSIEYYKKYFEIINEEVLRKEETGEIEQKIKEKK